MLDETLGKKLRNKKLLRFNDSPLSIKAIKGTMITVARPSGRDLTRNARFFKRCTTSRLGLSAAEEEDEEETERESTRSTDHTETIEQSVSGTLRCSERERRAPERYIDVRNKRGAHHN